MCVSAVSVCESDKCVNVRELCVNVYTEGRLVGDPVQEEKLGSPLPQGHGQPQGNSEPPREIWGVPGSWKSQFCPWGFIYSEEGCFPHPRESQEMILYF